MNIKLNKRKLQILAKRKKPEIYKKEKVDSFGKKSVEYKYMKCDYCGDEIKLVGKKEERTGGTMKLSYIITHCETVEIAACNKCVKPILQEFE